MKSNKILWAITAFLFVTAVFIFRASPAHADLMIYPIRAFFGDRDRVFDVSLLNTADEAATFKMALVNLKQAENGGYIEIEELLNPVFDPEKVVVFSPKQANLPAHGKQKLRISLRRPADLPDGEYRAHLRVERMADQKPPPQQAGKIVTNVVINLAYSIPVIVRQGVSDAVAKIGEIKLIPSEAKKPAFLEITIHREGRYSTMGNLEVFWNAPGQSETQIGTLNNFNVFPEISKRIGRIPLTTPNVSGGTLRIIYKGDGPDEKKIFDEKIFPVGG